VYHLARQLAAQHKVTVLSYALSHERERAATLTGDVSVRVVEYDQGSLTAKRASQALSIASLRPYACRQVHSERMQQAISELCGREAFDIIQLESSHLCGFSFPQTAVLVIDEHNVEYEVFQRVSRGERSVPRRVFNWVEYRRFRRFEQRWWKQVNACIVTSDREATIVRAHAPMTPVAVVPNGVDLAYFRPDPGEVEPRTVVFNGILTYRPNLDAAQHLVREIWPLVRRQCPDARLTIVGQTTGVDLRRMQRPGVEFVGEIPDIRPSLHRAAVVVVPVRTGGGTRLKVVESLAMGKATVCTSLGCEGLAVRDGEHLLIVDDAQFFAARVLELFDDPERRAALGEAGRRLVEREYSWVLGAERLEALYDRIVATGPPRSGHVSLPASAGAHGEASKRQGRIQRPAGMTEEPTA
jgi:polysaccharide biosynthesis protein PslH